MKLRCIIVDDEPLAIGKLVGFVEQINYLELMATFDNGLEALNYLKKQPVDLIFLDVQMDELDGIKLLGLLNPRPYVVLITAYDEFALQGFELEVDDYLLKPVGFQRFLKAADRVHHKETIRLEKPVLKSADLDNAYFFIRSDYQLLKVRWEEICYLEARKETVLIHCKDRVVKTIKTLRAFESKLPSPPFFRVHKSFIISFVHLDSISSQEVVIRDVRLPLGNFYKKSLLEYMKEM
ncbi:MAG: response regulator transcription factor [Bacteroidota bacterium]